MTTDAAALARLYERFQAKHAGCESVPRVRGTIPRRGPARVTWVCGSCGIFETTATTAEASRRFFRAWETVIARGASMH